MALVFICDTGFASTISGSPVPAGYVLPSCSSGHGSWQEFESLIPESTTAGTASFADTRISSEQMTDVLEAALMCLCVAYSVRRITNAILGKR